MLDRLEIPIEWLPTVHEGPDVTGQVASKVAGALGMPAGLTVAAGGGDNAAAAIGSGVVEAGQVSASIGTSGVVFAPSKTPVIDPQGRIQSFCHAVPGLYHVMGVTLAAGGSLRWWRDVNGSLDYEGLTTLAAQAPPGSEGLVFLPYLSGERTPHRDPMARGAFLGLQLRHTQAHLTRALMEGVVFSLKDCLDLITQLGLPVREIRATGGAARSPLWRHLQADIFGVPIHRNQVDEGPAFGAALLAGVACGVFASVYDACARIALNPDVTQPDPVRSELYTHYHAVYSQLYAATAPSMHRLHDLS